MDIEADMNTNESEKSLVMRKFFLGFTILIFVFAALLIFFAAINGTLGSSISWPGFKFFFGNFIKGDYKTLTTLLAITLISAPLLRDLVFFKVCFTSKKRTGMVLCVVNFIFLLGIMGSNFFY